MRRRSETTRRCKELAAFYLTYARDLIDERKYADVPAPAPRGSFAALAARASRDARNSREERVRNGLVAFARGGGIHSPVHF